MMPIHPFFIQGYNERRAEGCNKKENDVHIDTNGEH